MGNWKQQGPVQEWTGEPLKASIEIPKMKIFKVSQKAHTGYDTYSDFVVAAPDEEVARSTNPANGSLINWDSEEEVEEVSWRWASTKSDITVQHIGEALPGVEGILCASFHAG